MEVHDIDNHLFQAFVYVLPPHQRTRLFELLQLQPELLGYIIAQLEMKQQLRHETDEAAAEDIFTDIIELEREALGVVFGHRAGVDVEDAQYEF